MIWSSSSGDELVPEPSEDDVEQTLIDVGTAERRVPVGGQDAHLAASDPQHGGVERAAAEIVDENSPVAAGGQAVVRGRGYRLVEQFQHVDPGDDAGLIGRLALGETEVGRDRDDGSHLPR